MGVILLFLFGVLLCWFTLWAGEKAAKEVEERFRKRRD
jgi:hypothetical protein